MSAAVHQAGAPSCGSCGYDTTGLLSLTCPECGSDLRVAGITRGPVGGTYAGFFVSVAALLVPWAACGMMLVAFVSSLVPARHSVRQTTQLTGPRSAAYKSIDVVATGEGWEGERATVSVQLQLTPSGVAKPPAPLPVTAGTRTQAVLAWLSEAGINTQDPLVRDEAQATMMNAVRSLRTRHSDAYRSMSHSFSTGSEGPFHSVNTTTSGSADRSTIPPVVFGALWVGVLAAAVTFLWRAMRPRRAAAAA